MEVTLGPRAFRTKSEAARWLRGCAWRYVDGPPLDGEDDAVVRALLGCHPEAATKIGPGVEAIVVRDNGCGQPEFRVERLDGTEVDFSFHTALRAYGRVGVKTSADGGTLVRQAFRAEVRSQVDAVRARYLDRHGGAEGGIDVDHQPPFEEVLESFLRERSVALEDVGHRQGRRGSELRLTDRELAGAWRRYHARHATLVPMPATDHRAKHAAERRRP